MATIDTQATVINRATPRLPVSMPSNLSGPASSSHKASPARDSNPAMIQRPEPFMSTPKNYM